MNNIEIKIDYFSATFPLDVDDNESTMFKVHEMVALMAKYLNVKNFEVAKAKFATNNFNYQFSLGEHIILRLDGPMNDCYQKTCHLEMKGEGCRDFERRNPDKTWINLIYFMVELNARFKRIDIAIDDFKGEYVTQGWLLEKINKEQFTSIFRSEPNPLGTLKNGLTIQFGSNESKVELVIYDKKAEQKKRKKACNRPYWVRYEMRFRSEMAERIAYALSATFADVSVYMYGTKIQEFAFRQLYRILDIKADNNYSAKNQTKAPTDERWKLFLNNVEKGELAKIDDAIPNQFEAYMKAARAYISMWLLLKYLLVLRDPYLFELEIFKFMANSLEFSKQRFRRLNIYLDQFSLKTIDDVTLAELKAEFAGIVEEKELPF